MGINLSSYEDDVRSAVRAFWSTRDAARLKQQESGTSDQGERAGVTAGKNMDGFVDLVKRVVRENGLPDAEIHLQRRVLTLPGFFRPTKLWDMLVGRSRFAEKGPGTRSIIKCNLTPSRTRGGLIKNHEVTEQCHHLSRRNSRVSTRPIAST